MIKAYPLLFSYRDPVIGNGYVAGVEIHGRAILTLEDELFWVEGVNPGGIACPGETRGEALASFRLNYQQVLVELAIEADDFEEFRQKVEAMFHESSEPVVEEFEAAVAEVRRGNIDADWIERRPFDASEMTVQVVPLVLEPKANSASELAVAA
jgi:hypothetical protein